MKSGGGKGLTRQLINTAQQFFDKIVIAYVPQIKPSVLKEAESHGFHVFTNIIDLIKFISEHLGGK